MSGLFHTEVAQRLQEFVDAWKASQNLQEITDEGAMGTTLSGDGNFEKAEYDKSKVTAEEDAAIEMVDAQMDLVDVTSSGNGIPMLDSEASKDDTPMSDIGGSELQMVTPAKS